MIENEKMSTEGFESRYLGESDWELFAPFRRVAGSRRQFLTRLERSS